MASPGPLLVLVMLACCWSEAHTSTLSRGSAVDESSGREFVKNGVTGGTDAPKTSTIFPDEATPSHFLGTSSSKPNATVGGTTSGTPPNATDVHTIPPNTTHVHTTPNATEVYTTAPITTHVHTTPTNTTYVYTTTHVHTTPPNATNVYTTAPNTTDVHTTSPNTTHVYTTPSNTTHAYTTPNVTDIYTTSPNTTHIHTTPPYTTLPNTTSSVKTTRIHTTSSANTTAPPTTNIHTTLHVPTTTVPGPISGTWYVNQSGEPCLILQAAITINITYSTSPSTASAVLVSLPQSAESSGNCGPNTSHITLGLQSGHFNLTFTFGANVTVNGLKNAFMLSQVNLGYVLDKNMFPDSVADKPVLVQYSNFSNAHLSASMGSSLKCDAEQSFSLDRNHVLSISHVQVQPFSVQDGKFSKAETCPEDGDKGSHYNLGVAVALCVTVPVIFMAVFIGWHYFCVMRKRGGGKAYSALI
ncbi:PREDICTED: cell wall protein DAN4-like isoform X1 [Branchiostoma belcheri]|uniref:Lysosome-associated membrane glycoprotein 5 n=1 Tax=Branchiostoma belcheri TaxID=7741 RepID=A0A6P4ZEY1_BRABE|nr:PREDICTED: cell wall protein DAN4-like isoform X1 [Branchiostoma belcheri]